MRPNPDVTDMMTVYLKLTCALSIDASMPNPILRLFQLALVLCYPANGTSLARRASLPPRLQVHCVARNLCLTLHETPKVVDFIHHVGILLDYIGEGLGVAERHGQLFVESVVVPIHLSEPKNT